MIQNLPASPNSNRRAPVPVQTPKGPPALGKAGQASGPESVARASKTPFEARPVRLARGHEEAVFVYSHLAKNGQGHNQQPARQVDVYV